MFYLNQLLTMLSIINELKFFKLKKALIFRTLTEINHMKICLRAMIMSEKYSI